jgi:hypothetical protein
VQPARRFGWQAQSKIEIHPTSALGGRALERIEDKKGVQLNAFFYRKAATS